MAYSLATNPIQHGGNQSAIRSRLKLGNRPLVDFSAPLNALGPPEGAVAEVTRAIQSIDRYPEPGAPRLVRRLAEFHNVPPNQIIVGAGTTELISLIGHALRHDPLHQVASHGNGRANGDHRSSGEPRSNGELRPNSAHLVEPTYGEYRRTSVLNGLHTEIWDEHVLGWDQGFLPKGASGIFWTGHPNNPTGRAWDRERLLNLIDASPNLLTVVDEAYLPFLPDEADRTVVGAVEDRQNLIVLRSMTKIYGIPGLRIGYAVAPQGLVSLFKQFQQPWTIATSAEVAALAALDDDEYIERTLALIGTESYRLTDRLWDMPYVRPVWPARERPAWAPPLPNFVLVSLVDTPWTSAQVQDALARRGLFVRECSNYRRLEIGSCLTGPGGLEVETRGHLRFCVRTPEENDQLLSILSDVLACEPPR
jgi:threonine-phosphate decarboxylase